MIKKKTEVNLMKVSPSPFFFLINQGTTVYPLLMSVLQDPSEWEKPYTFHPAHFLDKEGKFVKREAFIPFSAGLLNPAVAFYAALTFDNVLILRACVQAAGFASAKVWPGWNSSCSSQRFCSTFVSRLRLAFQRMN